MAHTILTFITRVKPDKVKELRAYLKQIRDTIGSNTDIPFRNLDLLHYASFVVHDTHPGYAPCLVFESNFDGGLDDYLKQLCGLAARGLHQVYLHCEDYTVQNSKDQRGISVYLKAHLVRPNAYHIGNTGRAAKRIRLEQELRNALEKSADQLVNHGKTKSVTELFESLRKSIAADPRFASMEAVGPRQSFKEIFVPYARLVGFGLFGLAMIAGVYLTCGRAGVIAFVIIVLLLLAWLRFKESKDSVQAGAADSDNLGKLVEYEDRTHIVQNHMASITLVKDGWFRRTLLWLVLWAVNLLARAQATHGELSGISSIHFAHWSLIDNKKRLLFLSNFDGSWENYLDDFIDKAHLGLTAVWSNTVEFPRSYFLVLGGATDGPRFKALARDSQTVTDVWYSAYPELTVQNIDNNSSIREELFHPLNQPMAKTWLNRL